jgi:hypothetical protein
VLEPYRVKSEGYGAKVRKVLQMEGYGLMIRNKGGKNVWSNGTIPKKEANMHKKSV